MINGLLHSSVGVSGYREAVEKRLTPGHRHHAENVKVDLSIESRAEADWNSRGYSLKWEDLSPNEKNAGIQRALYQCGNILLQKDDADPINAELRALRRENDALRAILAQPLR
jgi:hypothetical protein